MTAPSPLAPEDELLYRSHFLGADGRRMLYGCGIGIVFNIVYSIADFSLFGAAPRFYLLLGDRLLFMIFSAATAWVIVHSRKVEHHDAMALAWGLLVVAANIPVVLSRPTSYTFNLVPELAGVMMLYLLMPDRHPWRLLPPLALTASSLALFLSVKEPVGYVGLQAVLSAFVVANLVGVVVSGQVYRYRRQAWTNERELRRLALQRQHMLATKDRMIATLSHEFRSPLNVIASSSSLLGQYHAYLDDKQRELVLGRMTGAIRRLTETLDEALFISRRDAHALSCQRVAVELRDWLERLAEELRGGDEGVHDFVVVIDCTAGVRMTDPVLLRLIVVNLVSNALKFTPRGGRVRLQARCESGGIAIEVSDRGQGIPEEELDYIFEPFHRAANASLIQGTGLGLTIVREATDLLGGRIDIVSRLGAGTTASVRLPCASAPEALPTAAGAAACEATP